MSKIKNTQNLKLIKPLVHPLIYDDEYPRAYLVKLANINKYAISWLLIHNNGEISLSTSPSYPKMLQSIKNTEWLSDVVLAPMQQQLAEVKPYEFLSSQFRFCPLCLKEAIYFRCQWILKTSSICLKHNVWLHDRCPGCAKKIYFHAFTGGHCSCGITLSLASVETAPDIMYHLHAFLLYGKTSSPFGGNSLISPNHDLSLEERTKLLSFLARWLPTKQPLLSPAATHNQIFYNMDLLKIIMPHIAGALFSGTKGFKLFLQKMHNQQYRYNSRGYQHFYQQCYQRLNQPCFTKLIITLETDIKQSAKRPLTLRNSLFSKGLLNTQLWAPLHKASEEFSIPVSVLKSASINKLIRSQKAQTQNRVFTAIYRSDVIELAKQRQADIICFKDVLTLLGVTKPQLNQLIAMKCFPKAKPPGEGLTQHWEFSKQEVLNYLDKILIVAAPFQHEDLIPIPLAMKIISNSTLHPLYSLLDAIGTQTIPSSLIDNITLGIRAIAVPKKNLINWIKTLKSRPLNCLTITEAAKAIGISQEMAYQLVNYQLLPTMICQGSDTRWISEADLQDFQRKYVLLGKLAKKLKTSSRKLISDLAQQDIFPVDHNWESKLRLKLYKSWTISKYFTSTT